MSSATHKKVILSLFNSSCEAMKNCSCTNEELEGGHQLYKYKPLNLHIVWQFENHDQDRVGKRFNAELSDILLITIMMLPGVAFIYYGQEIGMVNNKIRAGETRIPNSHSIHHWDTPDESRLPMQWDNTMNAGRLLT